MPMTYKVDLTGRQYGKLTVKEFVPTLGRNNPKWLCVCECGNETVVSKPHLVSGHTQSCGCLKRVHIPGSRWGKLTVLKDTGRKTLDGHRIVLCVCDCGKEVEKGVDVLLKDSYCKENNIRLVRIPYYDYSLLDYDYLIEKAYQ